MMSITRDIHLELGPLRSQNFVLAEKQLFYTHKDCLLKTSMKPLLQIQQRCNEHFDITTNFK